MDYTKKWRFIEGTENYCVSEDGDVYNRKYKRYLTSSKGKNGYPRVNIKGRVYYVHTLVCTAFWGPGEGRVVDHINRKKYDNHYTNLRWVTPAVNNTNRAIKKQIKTTKFTFDMWREIIDKYLIGNYSQHEISEWANIKFNRNSHVMIYNSLVNGRTFKNYYKELSTEELNKIKCTIEKYKSKK